jgi:quercetin dioxygenase-like cupin family protein
MKLTTRDESRQAQPADPSHFTGPASSRTLHRTEEPHPVNVNLVRFETGVRNHWHRHGGGQFLHVVEGEGWVQGRGEPARRLRAGDSVSTGPEEEHWHGAGAEGPMAHIAVSIGQITWLEPSEGAPD